LQQTAGTQAARCVVGQFRSALRAGFVWCVHRFLNFSEGDSPIFTT
jgi:hypothetical protein